MTIQNMVVSLAVIVFLSFYNADARTCVCAQFTQDSCEMEDNCLWHSREVTYGVFNKGDHGVCRSQKWMDCHISAECTIENHWVDQEQGEQSARRRLSVDQDWPYSCDETEGTLYYDQVINVRPYDLLAAKSAAEVAKNAFTGENELPMSVISTFIVLVSCLILVIITGIKCSKSKLGKELEQINRTSESYATF